MYSWVLLSNGKTTLATVTPIEAGAEMDVVRATAFDGSFAARVASTTGFDLLDKSSLPTDFSE